MRTRTIAVISGICLILALVGSQAVQGAASLPTNNTYLPLVLRQSPPLLHTIAFLGWTEVGTSDIFTMQEDGTQVHNLISDPVRIFTPRFSPDGTKIVFVADREYNLDIYTINVDGSGCTQLVAMIASDPIWAPSDQAIALHRQRSR